MVRNSAVPGTRTGGPWASDWITGSSGTLVLADPIGQQLATTGRQVAITANVTVPKATGNQPPLVNFIRLAPRKLVSTTTIAHPGGASTTSGQCHSLCATISASRVVISIVPLTAMPNDAASASDERKPSVAPITSTNRIELTAGR